MSVCTSWYGLPVWAVHAYSNLVPNTHGRKAACMGTRRLWCMERDMSESSNEGEPAPERCTGQVLLLAKMDALILPWPPSWRQHDCIGAIFHLMSPPSPLQMTEVFGLHFRLASFPGLPHLQFLIAYSLQKLEAIKSWRCGRPGNEATSGFLTLWTND